MRGTKRKISLPRRFLIDFMHASMRVPAISFSRPLDIGPLMASRAMAASRPGWAAVFAKAFAIVAKDEAVLRTLYVKLPWPHFFELPRSVAMVAVARAEGGEEFILPEKVPDLESRSLADIDAQIRRAKNAPLEDVPNFRKILMASRLPLPLRRLSWYLGQNFGRMCANNFGTFGVTSVAAYGPGELRAISPSPFLLSYGVVGPDNHIDVSLRWDHRITDAVAIARVLKRLEQVLNNEISAEIRSPRTQRTACDQARPH
ncbi:MAG TPA: acyltransferase [Bradyrhizobium sp.]|uniref:acyltransferase n=1 Tax=Bradyrhizobium sp. TaxID=376 RepID=UPI002D7ED57F|nr:acyltransferase [Bradyrhizobium sp.]HET7885585.1 acyltransferase [Bradyrhizobium sp.]